MTKTGLKLHAVNGSPPSRIAMLVLDVLGLDYEFVNVDLLGEENRKPEFLKVTLT